MAVDLESRARALLGRLGSVPADPYRAREFLQRRVRIYLGVAFAIWLAVFALDLALVFIFHKHQRFHIIAHSVTTVVMGALWVSSRGGSPSVRTLRALEV